MELSLFLAKLIGTYGALMGVLWGVGGRSFRGNVERALGEPGFLVLSGFVSVVAGLAIVLGHPVWEPSWRVVITLVGCLATAKGVVMLVCPAHLARVSGIFLAPRGAWLYPLIVTPLGGWLAWIGFSGG